MINRAKMPRQLRNKGGIMTIGGGGYTGIPMGSRTGFGIVSDIKDRVRKLIPNELADVAVKVAPVVAPFYPGYAAIARGLGRFDQRGSISDALKQGAATYGFGKGIGKLGGASGSELGNVFGRQQYSMEGFQERGLGRLFKGGEKKLSDADKLKRAKSIENTPEFMKTATEATIGKVPLLDKLPPMVQQKLLVGGVTAGASALYSYFTGEFEPQEPGETMGEYMARRNTRVKQQMRGYMDSYYTPLRNPQYAAMSDEEKNNFIDGIVGEQNDAMMATGGRVGYQVGGISSANTLAQNIAINKANQAAFQQSIAPAQQRARNKVFNVFMTPEGRVAKDQGIAQLARDTGKAPSVTNLPIKSGTDIARMIGPGTGIGVGNQSYSGGQQFSNLGFAALQPATTKSQTTTPTTTASQTNTAANPYAEQEKKFQEYDRMMRQKILEAYGKGTTNYEDFVSGKPYEAEAATLGMDPIVYMDYLLTSDPKGINYKYRKLDPYYDPQFDMSPPDPKEIEELSPLGMYYQQQLREQIKQGIPEAERIQRGQVFGVNPTSSMYESYADALARTRKQMGLAEGGMPTGIMRTNKAGVMERDYRDKGGFVPVGIKEKADDVPAMLSKNEFVFTADAVRGAGNGSIEKGAQKMYDTMKNLERRVV